jgi:AcrR family transcriptional regulator
VSTLRAARGKSASASIHRHIAARTSQQCERILDAAERCFIARGFHAASVAQIAADAGLSAGLIYRYFSSKNAMILAIIKRHVQCEGATLVDTLHTVEDVCTTLLDVFECWRRRDDPGKNAALFLELTAEATRDSEIERAVREKDRVVARQLAQLLLRLARSRGLRLGATAARARATILQCLVDGLALRSVRGPQLRRDQLRPLLERQILALITP